VLLETPGILRKLSTHRTGLYPATIVYVREPLHTKIVGYHFKDILKLIVSHPTHILSMNHWLPILNLN
jgi:hypothetical protein